MLLAGSALGASPPQNLLACLRPIRRNCHPPWALDPPPPPFVETKNQLRPLPQMPRIFSFRPANVIDPITNPVFWQ